VKGLGAAAQEAGADVQRGAEDREVDKRFQAAEVFQLSASDWKRPLRACRCRTDERFQRCWIEPSCHRTVSKGKLTTSHCLRIK